MVAFFLLFLLYCPAQLSPSPQHHAIHLWESPIPWYLCIASNLSPYIKPQKNVFHYIAPMLSLFSGTLSLPPLLGQRNSKYIKRKTCHTSLVDCCATYRNSTALVVLLDVCDPSAQANVRYLQQSCLDVTIVYCSRGELVRVGSTSLDYWTAHSPPRYYFSQYSTSPPVPASPPRLLSHER